MPFHSLAAKGLALLPLLACGRQTAAPVAPAQNPPSSARSAATDAIRGTVIEKIDAGQYSYLKLRTGGGEVWTAVSRTEKKVGEEAAVAGVAWMEDFKSPTLNRTWDRIAFGSLEEGGAAPQSAGNAKVAGGAAGGLPAGHPPIGAAAAGAPAESGPIKVSKAAGPQGRTVADIYAQRASLKDKKVAVRGKVVKATNGVLGKNWLHLRDGTGEGASSDLAVASGETAAVGDTVLVSGTVRLDRDLGAGYHYDVIIEDAQLKTE